MSTVAQNAVLRVNNLSVHAKDKYGRVTPIVNDISFSVDPGKVVALIGESGSGKTTIAMACMGYSRAGCYITEGHSHVRLDGTSVLDLDTAAKRKLRGKDIAYVAQSAAASFNSAITINGQVTETPVITGILSKAEALEKAVGLYRELDLPDPEIIGRRYPHQVSGGQLQRLMVAMAMICDPKLLILDEPTTALDVTTQIEVLKAFKKLIKTKHTSAIYISHDLAVVAQIADHVLVLKDGSMVEYGSVEQIIHAPRHDYTCQLIDAAHVMPSQLPVAREVSDTSNSPLLCVNKVTAGYGKNHEHLALFSVDLVAFSSRTIGVIGESGSGKTTLGRVISGLMSLKSGRVDLNGQQLNDTIDAREIEQLRDIQFAFQMADVALNPKHRISKIIGRPLQFYFGLQGSELDNRIAELLAMVELPTDYMSRFPRQLSGGERQRVNLARALAAKPRLIICDEITSALDTVVAQAILELLKDLQERLGVGYIFISHDLSTIAKICDEIAVMQNGRIVEYGKTREILSPPHHTYTEQLLNSVPDLRTNWLDELESVGMA